MYDDGNISIDDVKWCFLFCCRFLFNEFPIHHNKEQAEEPVFLLFKIHGAYFKNTTAIAYKNRYVLFPTCIKKCLRYAKNFTNHWINRVLLGIDVLTFIKNWFSRGDCKWRLYRLQLWQSR